MAEKRQKKQGAKAFEKETFSKDKEVTGAKNTGRITPFLRKIIFMPMRSL